MPTLVMKVEMKICVICNRMLADGIAIPVLWPKLYVELEVAMVEPRR